MTEDAPRGSAADASDDDDRSAESASAWRFGVDTAEMMAGRVRQMYEMLPSGTPWRGGDVDGELRRLRLDLERAADVSLDLFDRVLALLRRIDVPDGATTAAADATVPDELVVTVTAGSSGVSELWLHNVSDTTQRPPELRCGAVADFDGVQIPPEGVRVRCADAPIEGRNSRRVEFAVDVPADTVPGTYHGLVISAGSPLLTMRVRVVVT
jgi:hypothetical protein